jgi:hypothetical protein
MFIEDTSLDKFNSLTRVCKLIYKGPYHLQFNMKKSKKIKLSLCLIN